MTLMQRLQAHSPASEFAADEDDNEDIPDSSPPPLVLATPSRFSSEEPEAETDEDEDLRAENDVQLSPSPAPASNRTSVDGMDPAFVNILRRSGSGSAPIHGASPLRNSVLTRGARPRPRPSVSRRGGAAFQEARPPSFANEPEALANELGGFGFRALDDTFELPEPTKETAEFACQTEEEQPIPQVVVQSPSEPVIAEPEPVVPPRPVVSEIGIQVEPEPEPVPVRNEVSLQTDAEPVIEHAEVAIQHFDLTPSKVLVSTGSVTDPLP